MSEELSHLPDKKYFKIGEAANLLNVKPHVLRYWETEFPEIRPYKSQTGQRLYRRCDVEALLHIQVLLHKERYTIEGARLALRNMYDNAAACVIEDQMTESTEPSHLDVLEVVEEKMLDEAQKALGIEMTKRLENASKNLRDMLESLDA